MKSTVPQIKSEIQIGRFSVPYRCYGNGKKSIICLNGIQQSMAMWHSFIHAFSDQYRVVLFDFPDKGRGKIFEGPAGVFLR